MSESKNFEDDLILNDFPIPQRFNKISKYKKRVSKKKSYKDHFVEYTQNTSLHGFKYLGHNDNTIIDKIWWLIMIFISILTAAYFINIVWEKWQETPVIVTFAENSREISTIPFPSVTICPDIKIRQTVYNYTERFNNFLSENYSYTNEELLEFNSMAVLCDAIIFNFSNVTTDESIIGDIIRVSPKLNESLIECYRKFLKNGTDNLCESIFREILTDDGLCFTYNMLDYKDLYNENTLQYKYNFTYYKRNKGWKYDTGYDSGVDINTYPQRGIGDGLQSSMSVKISRNPIDFDETCASFISGIKVTIHPPNVIPRLSQHFFWIQIEKDTTFAITPKYMTTSEQLKSYTPERRGCYFSYEKKLKFFKYYTKENCDLECLTNYTMAVCNCATYYMPRDEDMPICSILDKLCQRYASESIHLDQHKYNTTASRYGTLGNYSEESKKIATDCNCLASCTSISYDADVSHTQLTPPDEDEIDGPNLSTIRIFFKDSHFIPTKRSELYGITDFLANCGGLLGLCLGFSFLSLIEIIYYLTIRIYITFRRNRAKQQQ